MLKRISEREQIAALLDQYTATVKAAFLEAVGEIRSRIVLSRIIERLERGDIEGAIGAMHLERAPFNPVLDRLADAFAAGGGHEADNLPILRDPQGFRVVFRFDVRNPAAEQWLREHSAQLVTNIIDDQRQAIRTALAEGVSRGDNPRRTALDVVGRQNRVTGRREGGTIGITAQQERYVAAARAELLSGDPELMRRYLGRERRDKRFDRSVMRAISAGKALAAEDVTRAAGRYGDRLLDLRGAVLAQNETFAALFAAKHEAFRQAIAAGNIDAQDVTKTWRHFPSEHPRMQHVEMAGRSAKFDEPFVMPDGTTVMWPHDPAAAARHTLGCKCQADYRVDFAGRLFRRRAA